MAAAKKSGDYVLGTGQLVGLFFLLVVVLGMVFTLGYLFGRNQYDTQLRVASGKAAVPVESDTRTSKISSAKPGKAEKPSRTASAREAAPAPPPAGGDWDFYHAGDSAKPEERLAPAPPKSAKALSSANRPASAANGNGGVASTPALKPVSRSVPAQPSGTAAGGGTAAGKSLNSPLIPRGATVLQVAALAREADALALAQALQSKKFPAFVLAPDADNFYRVQVGPYTEVSAANTARQRLENDGFKSIVKR